jgi:hypothetical protein
MSSQAETLARPTDAEIQTMLAKAVRLYADRVAENDTPLAAFGPDAANATQVMITVTAMLKAVNLQVFELGMWQAWGGK